MMIRRVLILASVASACAVHATENTSREECREALSETSSVEAPNAIIETARRAALDHLRATHDGPIEQPETRVRSSSTAGRGVWLIIDVTYGDGGRTGVARHAPFDVYVAPDGTATVHEP